MALAVERREALARHALDHDAPQRPTGIAETTASQSKRSPVIVVTEHPLAATRTLATGRAVADAVAELLRHRSGTVAEPSATRRHSQTS